MSFASKSSGTSITADKNQLQPATRKYELARSNLLIAILLTVVNIVFYLLQTDTYFLFSIAYPYYMFDTEFIIDAVLPLAVLALYVLCYFLSKKRPAFMVIALVMFIIDCLFLVAYSFYAVEATNGAITLGDFIVDYLTHIWVLVYLIIGACNCKRYREELKNPPAEIPEDFDNSYEEIEEVAAETEAESSDIE